MLFRLGMLGTAVWSVLPCPNQQSSWEPRTLLSLCHRRMSAIYKGAVCHLCNSNCVNVGVFKSALRHPPRPPVDHDTMAQFRRNTKTWKKCGTAKMAYREGPIRPVVFADLAENWWWKRSSSKQFAAKIRTYLSILHQIIETKDLKSTIYARYV